MYYYVVNDSNNKPYKITVSEVRDRGIEGIELPSLPIDLATSNEFEKIENNIYIRKGVN